MLELISIHIPKAGGYSFAEILRRVYGGEHVLRADAYDDFIRIFLPKNIKSDELPMEWKPNLIHRLTSWARRSLPTPTAEGTINIHPRPLHRLLRRDTKVLHGHFPFNKIERIYKKNKTYLITWMRDPVERVISNYYFFIKRVQDNSLPNTANRKNETLLEYARHEDNRNRMSYFLSGLELSDIDFIGFTEYFDDDLDALADLLGWGNVASVHLNSNKEYRSKYKPANETEKAEIRKINHLDDALFNDGLDLRAKRS